MSDEIGAHNWFPFPSLTGTLFTSTSTFRKLHASRRSCFALFSHLLWSFMLHIFTVNGKWRQNNWDATHIRMKCEHYLRNIFETITTSSFPCPGERLKWVSQHQKKPLVKSDLSSGCDNFWRSQSCTLPPRNPWHRALERISCQNVTCSWCLGMRGDFLIRSIWFTSDRRRCFAAVMSTEPEAGACHFSRAWIPCAVCVLFSRLDSAQSPICLASGVS